MIKIQNEGILKNYKITFEENKKYNPVTRTISILTTSDVNAVSMVRDEYGQKIKLKKVVDQDGNVSKIKGKKNVKGK